MTKLMDLVGFASELRAIDRDLQELGPAIVERACQLIQKKAKAAIGREHEMWAPLAPSTIEDKARKGFKTPAPLLRTGAMRDSIEYTVRGNEGAVGSNDPVAVYQELGTSRIPPRSFLVSSAIASEHRIHRMAAAATIAALSGHARNARSVGELMHAIHRAGHALGELVHGIMDDAEDAAEGRHQ